MAHRIEVVQTVPDARAEVRRRQIHSAGFPQVTDVRLADVYNVDVDLPNEELNNLASMLVNPVSEEAFIDEPFRPDFNYAIEIGFRPGVTDNVGITVRDEMSDTFGEKFDGQTAYSSQLMFLSGDITKEQARKIGVSLSNLLIQQIHVKSQEEFQRDGGMGKTFNRVNLGEFHDEKNPLGGIHSFLTFNDEELMRFSYNGTLALRLEYLKAIQTYFLKKVRVPTNVELESIAQTWSEHCKHTIFADPIDEIEDGLFKTFIKGATEEINKRRKEEGLEDICVSVFTDNAGGIIFDDDNLLFFKVETHNSPSAMDPIGGAITGANGVHRDIFGSGKGADVFVGTYGFCTGDPNDQKPLYRETPNKFDKERTLKTIPPKKILEGIVEGVRIAGNETGIPTPQGFVYFDNRFKGKPLVFVGAGGIIPRKVNGTPSHEKKAGAGDYIVMVGGRVGADGIHGATFSSEIMNPGSPATAVQIGAPITQKIMSDALIKEARDKGLYTSITDNGAGGLSSSVAEMAKEAGGFKVDLEKVPLKYSGLNPWEIWVSESQERMTLSIPKEKWEKFSELMQRRGVEATVIGEFTDSGECIVDYKGTRVMDLEMDFLHNGLPKRHMKTTFTRQVYEEPNFQQPGDMTSVFHEMLGRKNLASFGFISQQFDHEVQGGSVIKPLQGKGRVNGDATIVRPILNSNKAAIISQGINPSYSDIDTYHMAAAAIDTAIRNVIAVGGKLEEIALLDNFCWCSSDEPERLGQLKRAAKACKDVAVGYLTPFISGKDSMFNDFKGFDENGNPIKISVPPTLLISSVAVMDDSRKAVSLDAKFAGDIVYVVGETRKEMGGSEYYAMMGEKTRGEKFVGNDVPEVDVETNTKLYQKLSVAMEKELVASAQSIHKGGLAMALAKTSMGGKLGMEVDIQGWGEIREDELLYSESQGRLVITVNPEYAAEFERTMEGSNFRRLGVTRSDGKFIVNNKEKVIVNTEVNKMLESYKSTLRDY
ncbi:phosphoribosylformylglycinamidine synthase [Candidatus Pacearchaeota archaeon]|nr:phosphoribosylformylglycinamidine synthase [Candidatus Pacearchaeota archaeon]